MEHKNSQGTRKIYLAPGCTVDLSETGLPETSERRLLLSVHIIDKSQHRKHGNYGSLFNKRMSFWLSHPRGGESSFQGALWLSHTE